MARVWGTVFFLIAGIVSAQTVDWTRTASTLDQLNAQILDWSAEYQRTAAPGGLDAMAALVELHFKRGPVVASGLNSLLTQWLLASETQRKSRYLAISRYFVSHTDDWGSSVSWIWYRCFSPPLDARYNMLADDEGQPTVTLAPQLRPDPAQQQALLNASLVRITTFLTAYGYPIVDTPLTRFRYDTQDILLDGLPPRDQALLNKSFTYSGTLIGLFGAGF